MSSVGSLVAEVLLGTVRGALAIREHLSETERAELDAALDDARAELADLPVLTGPGGEWTDDADERLGRG